MTSKTSDLTMTNTIVPNLHCNEFDAGVESKIAFRKHTVV